MSSLAFASIKNWQYDDIAAGAREAEEKTRLAAMPLPSPGLSEAQVALRVQGAVAEAEARWAAQAEAEGEKQEARMTAALEAFSAERASYFRRVETEVVHLALGIAKKILQREAELDPTLLSGLVRIALDRMGVGSSICLRVHPSKLSTWQGKTAWKDARYTCELVADDALQPDDCVVETDIGTANFAFDTQLKEIEAGLLGILAQRPEKR